MNDTHENRCMIDLDTNVLTFGYNDFMLYFDPLTKVELVRTRVDTNAIRVQ